MRKHILSALYSANAALQHWLDVGVYDVTAEEEITALTLDIDGLRITIESDGFDEFARMKCRSIGDTCGKLADKHFGYGSHLLRFMAMMGGAL